MSLKILRAIAKTTMPISLESIIAFGDIGFVCLALETGEIVDEYVFIDACTRGHTEIVRLLLDLPWERGVDPSARDNKSLRFASRHGHTEIVRMLLNLPLDRGVNPEAYENEALRVACYRGQTDLVPLLLELEICVDPAASDNWGFHSGHTEIVRMLLDLPLTRGVNPAAENNEALQFTCSMGHTQIVRILLELPTERGVDPRVNGLIQYAIQHGHTEIVRLLLEPERGVNLLVALQCAILNGRTEIQRMLEAKIPWYRRMFL